LIEFQPVIVAVAAALLYSLLWFSRQVVDPTKETPKFDPWKMGATLVVGACIGLVSVITGIEISQAGIEAQLTSYGFLVAVVEQVGRAIYRNLTQVE
jgi:uncharacterized membrane protein YfcA